MSSISIEKEEIVVRSSLKENVALSEIVEVVCEDRNASRCSYSSSKGPAYSGGRLGDLQRYWAPAHDSAGQWFQHDLGTEYFVLGVRTKGGEEGQYVLSYQVSVGAVPSAMQPVDNGFQFSGNSDASSTQISTFERGVFAQHVRITIKQWHGHIAMRSAVVARYVLPRNAGNHSIKNGMAVIIRGKYPQHLRGENLLLNLSASRSCDMGGERAINLTLKSTLNMWIVRRSGGGSTCLQKVHL